MITIRRALLCLVLVLGCAYLQPRETVPYTGRERLPLRYSEKEMNVLGAEAYADVLKKYPVVKGTRDAEQVERVGRRLAGATGKDYDWEFHLLKAPDVVNAFCLPGGKIAVFTGMEQMIKSDDDMAVVLGHEIAHAILQHSNERMSQPLAEKLVGMPTNIVVGVWGTIAPHTRKVVMNGLGLGYLVGEVLPYDQKQETEADMVGLIFMQRAGYDLDAAPPFWKRMAADSQGRVTDSVSTHPDPEKRAEQIQQRIAEMKAGD
jgi:predicted Zn-dependent protease